MVEGMSVEGDGCDFGGGGVDTKREGRNDQPDGIRAGNGNSEVQ